MNLKIFFLRTLLWLIDLVEPLFPGPDPSWEEVNDLLNQMTPEARKQALDLMNCIYNMRKRDD